MNRPTGGRTDRHTDGHFDSNQLRGPILWKDNLWQNTICLSNTIASGKKFLHKPSLWSLWYLEGLIIVHIVIYILECDTVPDYTHNVWTRRHKLRFNPWNWNGNLQKVVNIHTTHVSLIFSRPGETRGQRPEALSDCQEGMAPRWPLLVYWMRRKYMKPFCSIYLQQHSNPLSCTICKKKKKLELGNVVDCKEVNVFLVVISYSV